MILLNKVQGSVVLSRIGMKFGTIVLQVNRLRVDWLSRIFDLASRLQDGGLRRKVPPPGECTRSVCSANATESDNSWSMVLWCLWYILWV